MVPMNTSALHHYTFKVTQHGALPILSAGTIRRVGVEATSPANAEAAIHGYLLGVEHVELLSLEKIGDGCGDERCAVCHPSSRNRGV
jgi:hypothetical protein